MPRIAKFFNELPASPRICTLLSANGKGDVTLPLYNEDVYRSAASSGPDRRRMLFKYSLGAWLLPGVLLAAGAVGLHAQGNTAPFDLNGPRIDMRVTRGGKTLPIANVPNLQPGDKVWVHPELPPSQSAHYLLVVAFLRGATNPPPENWFLKQETWQKKSSEGLHLTVPAGAQ